MPGKVWDLKDYRETKKEKELLRLFGKSLTYGTESLSDEECQILGEFFNLDKFGLWK